MGFLGDQLRAISKRRLDVANGDSVLFFNFRERHSAGKAAHNDGHRNPRSFNNRFAVVDFWVNKDALVHSGSIASRYDKESTSNSGMASECRPRDAPLGRLNGPAVFLGQATCRIKSLKRRGWLERTIIIRRSHEKRPACARGCAYLLGLRWRRCAHEC